MKEVKTTPGKTYSVHTSSGCTVSDKNGWSKTIEAPDGYFDAHFGSVVIEGDDEASIKELFKLAPYQKLRLLGVVGGNVPAWLAPLNAELAALLDGSKFELAWLAGKNTLVVHTDRVSDELLAAVKATAEAAMPATSTLVQYNHNMEISWRDINKYAACVNTNDLIKVNPNYKSDLTSDGTWPYHLTSFVWADATFKSSKIRRFEGEIPVITGGDNMFRETLLTSWNIELPMLQQGYNMFRQTLLTSWNIELPELWNGECMFMNVKLSSWNIELPELSRGDRMFRETLLTSWNIELPKLSSAYNMFSASKLTSWNGGLPKLSAGENMFGDCQLNKSSALQILNSIPAYTSGKHPLGIGIHIDHKTDEEVLAAISNAEAKGWTLTVQWNGTPTSTASTMAMGSLIYAKVSEMERPDGTTERVLDWGHYVTNPEGYETFRSLASAYRYFELPMPEELTNN